MKEADIRAEAGNLLMRAGFWPLTQTNLQLWKSPAMEGALQGLEGAIVRIDQLSRQHSLPTITTQVEVMLETFGILNQEIEKKVYPPGGRPDLPCTHPSQAGCAVEAKAWAPPEEGKEWEFAPAFSFKNVRPEQRTWLDNWDKQCQTTRWSEEQKQGDGIVVHHPDPGAFIALGTRFGRPGSEKHPRMLWIIPWSNWKDLEAMLKRAGQDSIPLVTRPGMRKLVQAENLCAMNLFSHWACLWKQGRWVFPAGHILEPSLYSSMAELQAMWPRRRRRR